MIAKVFPLILTEKGILYAYDDTIYSPDGFEIPHQLVAHEEVHARQQGGKPDVWWERYLEDAMFRFEQELEAHVQEWKSFSKAETVRNQRRVYLTNCARRLSGPLYGRCVTFERAKRLIKEA